MYLFTSPKYWLVAMLLVTTFFIGQNKKNTLIQKNMEITPISEKDQMVPGYNASSRTNMNRSWDVCATGSFIYWQPIQENMELGMVSDITNILDFFNGKVVELDFEYKPGFKVALGMNFDYDNWDSYLEYTWLRGSHHIHTTLDPNNTNITLHPAWQFADFNNPQYSSGSEKWQLHIDFLNWDLARSYFVGTKLSFRPFLGARAAWIRQNVQVEYRNGLAASLATWPNTNINQSSHSWGIGPRVGLTSNWDIGHGLRMYGVGETDILYTQYTNLNTKQESINAAGNIISRSRYLIHQKDANYLRTHLELALGFGWGTYFANHRWHVDLSADYGFQAFFNQNMFRNFVDVQAVAKSISPNGNLYIHGLTTSLRFDF